MNSIRYMVDATIQIMDDTLREGMQTPHVMFTKEEKLMIAKRMFDAGVRRFMVSYPSSHVSEQQVTSEILRNLGKATVFALGRAIKQDIDIIASTGSNIAIHLPFTGRYEEALESCRYAKDRYAERQLSVALVDIGSYSLDNLVKMAKDFEKNGADVLELPDTTGILNPKRCYEIIKRVRKEVSCIITAHCHNDGGLAVANSLAAFEAGADVIDCTALGLGERNGIADIAIVSNAIESSGIDLGINIEKLKDVYTFLNEILYKKTGINFISPNYPLFGEFVSIHTAGTHADSQEKFRADRFSVNVYCGKALIRKILESKGIMLDDATVAKITSRVKDECADTGKALGYDRVEIIAKEVMKFG
ncbi:MAG: LeuA family protein [Candidatus Parvarchaeota archaeon]